MASNNDTTIIYYTANHESDAFEQKIRDNILRQSHGMPIISVSQKPIDFGRNICVGNQPFCELNMLRQQLIGLEAADTKFALAAESDVLYPPEYFAFIPPTEDNVYRYTNVWILFPQLSVDHLYEAGHIPNNFDGFWKKRYTEGAQICGREYWIKNLKAILGSNPEWFDDRKHHPKTFFAKDEYSWSSWSPVVSVKTRNGLRKYTATSHVSTNNLEYWGSDDEVRTMLDIN